MIPREYSSGPRQRLGGLSKQGNPLLRFLWGEAGAHAGREGHTPVTGVNADRSLANLSSYQWQKHCRGLYQTPIAA
jgi:transposase